MKNHFRCKKNKINNNILQHIRGQHKIFQKMQLNNNRNND